MLDRGGKLSPDLQLFDGRQTTWVIGDTPIKEKEHLKFLPIDFSQNAWLATLLQELGKRKIAHLTVEGGSWLLQQFVAAGTWDEARVFTTTANWNAGKPTPKLGLQASQRFRLLEDELAVYYKASIT